MPNYDRDTQSFLFWMLGVFLGIFFVECLIYCVVYVSKCYNELKREYRQWKSQLKLLNKNLSKLNKNYTNFLTNVETTNNKSTSNGLFAKAFTYCFQSLKSKEVIQYITAKLLEILVGSSFPNYSTHDKKTNTTDTTNANEQFVFNSGKVHTSDSQFNEYCKKFATVGSNITNEPNITDEMINLTNTISQLGNATTNMSHGLDGLEEALKIYNDAVAKGDIATDESDHDNVEEINCE